MFYLGPVSHCFAPEYFTFLHNLRVYLEAGCKKEGLNIIPLTHNKLNPDNSKYLVKSNQML